MWIWVVLFVLSFAVNIALGIILYRATRSAVAKLDTAEQFVFMVRDQLQYVLTTIRKIDARGAFEADDEVGAAFLGIKETINTLNSFIELEKPK